MIQTVREPSATLGGDHPARLRVLPGRPPASGLDGTMVLEALANSPDAYVAVDARGRVLEMNAAAERLFGTSRDSVVGRPVADTLVPETARPRVRRALARVRRGGRSSLVGRRLTGAALGADGVEIPVELTVTATGPEGDRVFVACVRDHPAPDPEARHEEERRLEAQARRRAARARRAARRVAALEQAKSQFLRIASHELRGPLSVLRGYLAMIEEGACGELSPQLEHVLPLLVAKVRQMNALVDEMLDTARLEDGRLVLRRTPVDLRDVVLEAVHAVEGLARPGQRLDVGLPEHRVPVVGDPARLALVVVNLLQNAFRYSPDGASVRCTVEVDGATAWCAVSDDGIGIAEESMALLFTPFGRVVTAENSHIPGTGLGLYLARQLARMHGGDVTVRSVSGVGSTFRLVLPVAAVDAAGAAAPGTGTTAGA